MMHGSLVASLHLLQQPPDADAMTVVRTIVIIMVEVRRP